MDVRTVLDNPTKRPERQTALVALELERYNIDVCCLQETRFPGQGQLCEKGYTFYWSGRNSNERREAGVAFAIANNIAKDLVCFPQTISDRLIKLRLPLNDNRHLTIICCYVVMLLPWYILMIPKKSSMKILQPVSDRFHVKTSWWFWETLMQE